MENKEIRKANLEGLIRKYAQESGMTKAGFADLCDISPSVLSQMTGNNPKRNVGDRMARKIEASFNLPSGWMDHPRTDINTTKPDTVSSVPPTSRWSKIEAWDGKTPLNEDEVEVPFLKDIEFACGDGKVVGEDYNGFKLRFSKATLRRVGANSDGSGVLCFPASGDSMEPIIPDGATVAVDTGNKRIIDGELYAINQGELKRIKQLYRKPGGKVLIRSINRDYDDEEANENDIEVIGFVFWYSVLRYRR